MPEHEQSAGKLEMGTVLKRYWIPGLWLLSVPLYCWAGAGSDSYAIAELHANPSYPVRGVLICIVITAIESLALYAILRPSSYLRSWKRPFAALLLFFPWLAVCALLLMHQPFYVFMHAAWLLLVNLILAALCIYSLAASLATRRRLQRQSS
jgi:predicted Abi (CAAX) family protease